MAVTPIRARCRACRQDFYLFQLLDHRTGNCPRCQRSLTPDWTATLLDEAARADVAQRQLIASLRRLHNLPGNVSLRPHTVLGNLFEEVGWHKDIAEDPDTLREELRELRRYLAAFELLDPVATASQPRRSRIRRAIDRFAGRRTESTIVRPTNGDRDEHGIDPQASEHRDPPAPSLTATSLTTTSESRQQEEPCA